MMGTIEVKLELKEINDKIKSMSGGLKEIRTVKFMDVDGKGIAISLTCNKADHPLRDWDKTIMLDTGISIMALTLPKAKQMTIDKFQAKKKVDVDSELDTEIEI